MVEEFLWFVCWLLILYGVHIQFKYCIPVGLWCLKIFESVLLLIVLKIVVFINIYGNGGFDMTVLRNVTVEAVKYTKDYISKLEL